MKIGIDISQIAFHGGVGEYLTHLIVNMINSDQNNEFILFGSSLRAKAGFESIKEELKDKKNVTFKIYSFPISFLSILWNNLHIGPIELFTGPVDLFISSDWTQPPSKHAKMVTILYDVIVYKFPEETSAKIVNTQRRKLDWVKKEVDMVLCISESTKKDALELLDLKESKLRVVYPGFTL